MTNEDRSRSLRDLTARLVASYRDDGGINRAGEKDLPSHELVAGILAELLAVVFPGYHGAPVPRDADLEVLTAARIDRIASHLEEAVERTLRFCHQADCVCEQLWELSGIAEGPDRFKDAARYVTLAFLKQLPEVRGLLAGDVQAAYEGDPAATNTEEVILCYPGVLAVAVHRLAHPLQRLGVPLLPRMMSEWAHRQTGVDIHPGASIGPRFFIDHGTGVVIGETTDIGAGVKIYQSVTLGALSFQRNPDGTLVKGGKRHPTLGDGVTVYANATILGGETVIGAGAVIGGGAWVTSSVPAGGRVTIA
ncbi:MAG TPA: serine acetyltransferase [Candidatus Krumholzibacteria bacterium]|nr:serine acetyltransferase [Candidatus Krumholzibacteria bacterium]